MYNKKIKTSKVKMNVGGLKGFKKKRCTKVFVFKKKCVKQK